MTWQKAAILPSLIWYNYNLQGDQPGVSGTYFQKAASWDVSVSLQWTFWEWGKTYHQVGESRVKNAARTGGTQRDR